MDRHSPIGIFDSGIGGLTIFKELRELLPAEDLIYFGDTARMPYGSRPQEQIREFVDEILAFIAHNQVKLAVVACNTITALGLDTLPKNYEFKLIGVNTGALLAAKASRNKRIGVLATKRTIESRDHVQSIQQADPNSQVFGQACPLLAPLVETEHYDDILATEAVKEYVLPLQEAGVDTVVLACTHYPFLSPVISRVLGKNVIIVDPARETALEAQTMLAKLDLLNPGASGSSKLCFSADLARAERISQRILHTAGYSFELVNLSDYYKGSHAAV